MTSPLGSPEMFTKASMAIDGFAGSAVRRFPPSVGYSPRGPRQGSRRACAALVTPTSGRAASGILVELRLSEWFKATQTQDGSAGLKSLEAAGVFIPA